MSRATRSKGQASNPPVEEEQPIRAFRSTRKTTASGARVTGVNTPGSLTRLYEAPFEIRTRDEGELYKKLKKRGIADQYAIHWPTMERLHLREGLEGILDLFQLGKMAKSPHEFCEDLIYEFFTTLKEVPGEDASLAYRLGGKELVYTLQNLCDDFELDNDGIKWMPTVENFDDNKVWNLASGKAVYDPHKAKLNELRDIYEVVFLKWYGHCYSGRHEYNKVARSDLLALRVLQNVGDASCDVNVAYRFLKLVQEVPRKSKRLGFGWFIMHLARKDSDFDETKYRIAIPKFFDEGHLATGGFVKKGRISGKYGQDIWEAAHPGEQHPFEEAHEPRETPAPRREKEQPRRKDKHVAGTSAEGEEEFPGVPEGAQWEQPAPYDFEADQRAFMAEQRRLWKKMEYRQERMQHRMRRHEQKMQEYFNAQGGPRFPSPTPSPEPPEFD